MARDGTQGPNPLTELATSCATGRELRKAMTEFEREKTRKASDASNGKSEMSPLKVQVPM